MPHPSFKPTPYHQAPTVHRNGTSKAELLALSVAANEAICDAMNALSAASPHGRDYYVGEPGAFAKAQAEHTSEMATLRAIGHRLMSTLLHIDNQGE